MFNLSAHIAILVVLQNKYGLQQNTSFISLDKLP